MAARGLVNGRGPAVRLGGMSAQREVLSGRAGNRQAEEIVPIAFNAMVAKVEVTVGEELLRGRLQEAGEGLVLREFT